MPIAFEIADHIFRAEKLLLKPFQWHAVAAKRANEQRKKLECRVEVAGAVPRGVFFRITVYPRSLARASFQLECDLPSGRSHVPLYRLEVDPLRPHVNKPYGPDEINGLPVDAGQTHEHVFYDSLKAGNVLRANACEQARIVNNPPRDFPTGLGLACSRINVVNGHEVPSPGDQGQLL